MKALGFDVFRKRGVMLVELTKSLLEVGTFYVALVLTEKHRNDAPVKVVARCEDAAKGQIVKVGDIDHVVRFAGRTDARDEVGSDREVEKEVNEVDMPEVRNEGLDRGLAGSTPTFEDMVLQAWRDREDLHAETECVLLVHGIDENLGELLYLAKVLGLGHAAIKLAERSAGLGMVDSGDAGSPESRILTLHIEELAGLPAVQGLFFRAHFVDDALLVVQCDRLAACLEDAAVHRDRGGADQLVLEQVEVKRVHLAVHIGSFVRELAYYVLRRAAFADFFLDVGERFDEEERSYIARKEMVEPDCLVRIDALQKRLVERQRRPLGHLA